MKLVLLFSAFLPILSIAASIDDRNVRVMDAELATVDVKTFGTDVVLDVMQLKTAGGSEKTLGIQFCPPGYPKYCPLYNFCCPAIAQACCPRACCLSADAFCGTDGLCYRRI